MDVIIIIGVVGGTGLGIITGILILEYVIEAEYAITILQ